MIRKIFLGFFLVVAATGCTNAVKYTVSDDFDRVRPNTVAVLPVEWSNGDEPKEVSRTFRLMAAERLKALNYNAGSVETVDSSLKDLGENWLKERSPAEAASGLKADSVLLIRVYDWDKDTFASYASLRVKVKFELIAGSGERLWEAEYETKESDIRLDREPMELAVFKIYEPRVQRLIDIAFATLPRSEAPKDVKTFFQWLP